MDLSDSHSYSKMNSSDVPNPLRPYYKPPSIGIPEPNPNQSGPASPPLAPRRPTSSSRDFRELFSDLDYGDYLPQASPSVAEMAKNLVDKTIWNYSSTFLAQPFEVAKIILQCYDAGAGSQQDGATGRKRVDVREPEVCN
jgi:fusion and transport protein UGO1